MKKDKKNKQLRRRQVQSTPVIPVKAFEPYSKSDIENNQCYSADAALENYFNAIGTAEIPLYPQEAYEGEQYNANALPQYADAPPYGEQFGEQFNASNSHNNGYYAADYAADNNAATATVVEEVRKVKVEEKQKGVVGANNLYFITMLTAVFGILFMLLFHFRFFGGALADIAYDIFPQNTVGVMRIVPASLIAVFALLPILALICVVNIKLKKRNPFVLIIASIIVILSLNNAIVRGAVDRVIPDAGLIIVLVIAWALFILSISASTSGKSTQKKKRSPIAMVLAALLTVLAILGAVLGTTVFGPLPATVGLVISLGFSTLYIVLIVIAMSGRKKQMYTDDDSMEIWWN
jgi:hypothetical protein